MGAASGTMWWEDAASAAAGIDDPNAPSGVHSAKSTICIAEDRKVHSHDDCVCVVGAHGVRLHCSRESAGWDSQAAVFDVHHGRIHVGHALIFIYLEDLEPGEGGLLVV